MICAGDVIDTYAQCAATLEQARAKGPVDGDVLNLLAQAYMDACQAQKAIDVSKFCWKPPGG